MIHKVFEPIEEVWKHGGLMWQVLYDGYRYDISTKPMCTNCFYELGGDFKCEECGKQHKNIPDIGDAALRASKSYTAARKRKSYTVLAPQVGEKIAEVDLELNNEQFMNVKLENRKGSQQVVVTTGITGASDKAQIFIDLAKNEIRHDQTNLNPGKVVSSIQLNAGSEKVRKEYNAAGSRARALEHPYIYVNNSTHTKWADSETVSLNIKSDESDEYFLEQVVLEKQTTRPNKPLSPKSTTVGITLDNSSLVFTTPTPMLEMVVSRGNSKFTIRQEIATSVGDDGRFHFVKWIERPSSITSG